MFGENYVLLNCGLLLSFGIGFLLVRWLVMYVLEIRLWKNMMFG